jgi:hypothetical protein
MQKNGKQISIIIEVKRGENLLNELLISNQVDPETLSTVPCFVSSDNLWTDSKDLEQVKE